MSDIYNDWQTIHQDKADKAKSERDAATLRHLASVVGEQVNTGGWIADESGARLEVNGVNKLDTGLGQFFKVGSDTSDPEHTALAIFLEDQNYNTEDFSESDMLFGCNSTSFANMFWDVSAGQMKFRGGTTTQLYIDTDGSLTFGAGAGWLDADGQNFVLASLITDTPNQIKWMDGTIVASKIGAYKVLGTSLLASFWYTQGVVTAENTELILAVGNYDNDSIAFIDLWAPEGAGVSVITLTANSVILPNNSVSYAEMQNTAAANVVLGQTGTAGDIVEIACTAAMRGLMDDASLGAMKATLDLEIGVDVQAWDAQLDQLAACQVAADGDFIVGLYGDGGNPIWHKESKSAARTSMGLGTAAVENVAAMPALTMTGTISMAGYTILLQNGNLSTGTIGGAKIGTTAAQMLAFWGATPVAQQAHIANATGGLVVDAEARAAIASINAMLAATGLTAAS